MHYAMKRMDGAQSLGESGSTALWVPMPGLVYDLHALDVGQYLLYEASGTLKADESDGIEVTVDVKAPRNFRFDRKVEVYDDEGKRRVRTL